MSSNMKDQFKELANKKGHTMTSVAKHLGTSKQIFSQQLERRTIKQRDYVKALNFIGFDVILRERK